MPYKDATKRKEYKNAFRRKWRTFLPCQQDRHSRCIGAYVIADEMTKCNCSCHGPQNKNEYKDDDILDFPTTHGKRTKTKLPC